VKTLAEGEFTGNILKLSGAFANWSVARYRDGTSEQDTVFTLLVDGNAPEGQGEPSANEPQDGFYLEEKIDGQWRELRGVTVV